MGQGASFHRAKDNENFFRLANLLLHVSTNVLRELFKTYYATCTLAEYLASPRISKILSRLLKRQVLTKKQYALLYPQSGIVDAKTLDFSTLICLLRHLHDTIRAMDKVWTAPSISDRSIEADICRMRKAATRFRGHTKVASIPKDVFQREFGVLESILLRLLNTLPPSPSVKTIKDEVKQAKTGNVDQKKHQRLLEELKDWKMIEENTDMELLGHRDKLHQRVLKSCLPYLVKEMEFDVITEHMTSMQLIKDKQLNVIKEEQSGLDRERALIAFLLKQGRSVYDSFLDCLLKANKRRLKDRLVEMEHALIEEAKRRLGERGSYAMSDLMEDTVTAFNAETMRKRTHVSELDIRDFVKVNESVHTETGWEKEVIDRLTKHKLVILTGIPGAGKTHAAFHVMHDVCTNAQLNMKPLHLRSPLEVSHLVDPRERFCVFMDDFLGEDIIDEILLGEWRLSTNTILSAMKTGTLYVILTTRSSILYDLKQSSVSGNLLGKLQEILDDKHILDLNSTEYKLNGEIKATMISSFCKKPKIFPSTKEINRICELKEVVGFPLTCRMLHLATKTTKISEIFSNPYSFMKTEIETMRRKSFVRYITLALNIVSGGTIAIGELKENGTKMRTVAKLLGSRELIIDEIRQTLDKLCTFYLWHSGEKDVYAFSHDFVKTAVLQSVVNNYPEIAIRYCNVRLLSTLSTGAPGSQSRDQVILSSGKGQLRIIRDRFCEILSAQLEEDIGFISKARIWESQDFTSSFFNNENVIVNAVSSPSQKGNSMFVQASKAGNIHLLKSLLEQIRRERKTSVIEHQLILALKVAIRSQNIATIKLLLPSVRQSPDEVLVCATEVGNVEVFNMLVDNGGTFKCVFPERLGKTLLHFACLSGHYDMTRHILEKCPNLLEMSDSLNRSSLYLAAIGGNLDVVKELIDRGLDIDCKGRNGQNLIHVSCLNGNTDVVKYLATHFPHLLGVPDMDDATVLHYAAAGGFVYIFDYLVNIGVNPGCLDAMKQNVLHYACRYGQERIVKYIIETYSSLIQGSKNDRTTLLHTAAYGGRVKVLDILLKYEDPRRRTADGRTLLHFACKGGGYDMVRYLMKLFPEMVRTNDDDGVSVQHLAAYGGNITVLDSLVNHMAVHKAKTNQGYNLLHFACKSGKLAMVKHLADLQPAMLKERNHKGESVLHSAVSGTNTNVVDFLLKHGGLGYDCMTDKGQTLLHFACKSGNKEMAQYLVSLFPKLLDQIDDAGVSALHLTAYGGNNALLGFLVEKGLESRAKTQTGRNALHFACKGGSLSTMVELVNTHPEMIKERDNRDVHILHTVAFGGQVQALETFLTLQDDLDVRCKNKDGYTLLHYACRNGMEEMTRYLVKLCPQILQETGIDGHGALHAASQGGNVRIFEFLLEQKLNPKGKTQNGRNLLHLACEKAKEAMARKLLKLYPEMLNDTDDDGISALHLASCNSPLTLLDLLLQQRRMELTRERTKLFRATRKTQAVNHKDLHTRARTRTQTLLDARSETKMELSHQCVTHGGRTLLHYACEGGNNEVIEYLIKRYPKVVFDLDHDGATILHWTAYGGNTRTLEFVLHNDLNYKVKTFERQTLLHYACKGGKDKMTTYLADNYPDMLKDRDIQHASALHWAAYGGNSKIVGYLLRKGFDPSSKTHTERTIMHYACQGGHYKMVTYLLDHYQQMLKETDGQGATVLHWAAYGGNIDVLDFLLKQGENLNSVTQRQQTLLHYACEGGHERMVRHLVSLNSNMLQHRDTEGATALHLAAFGGSPKVLDFIIEEGLDYKEKTNDGLTLLHYACVGGKEEMSKLLIQRYPDMLKEVGKEHVTALHGAAYGWNTRVLDLLIQKGLDQRMRTKEGSTLLHLASGKGNEEMVRHIVKLFPESSKIADNNGATPLHLAAGGGNIRVLDLLIEEGLSHKVKTNDGRTLLHFAAAEGREEMVKHLVRRYPEMLALQDNSERSAIHLASAGGHIGVLDILLALDPKGKLRAKNGLTFLHMSCKSGKEKMTKHIIERFPDCLQEMDNDGATALHWAAHGGNVSNVKYLQEIGMDHRSKTRDGCTIMHYASRKGKKEMTKYLAERYPEMLEETDNRGRNVLHVAASEGHKSLVDYLVEKGVDPHSKASDGRTMLHYACASGKDDLVKHIVKRYPKILKDTDYQGAGSLHWAAYGGNEKILQILLEQGLDPKSKTLDGRSVLHYACEDDNIEMTKTLQKQYPDMAVQVDNQGQNLLHLAALNGKIKTLDYLLAQGMDAASITYSGRTVLHCACEGGQEKMVEHLAKRFPDMLQQRDRNGLTPLHWTSIGGNTDVLKLLTEKGLDPRIKTYEGRTLLHFACKAGNEDMPKLIIESYPEMIKETDNQNATVLHWAAYGGNVKVLDLILQNGADHTFRTRDGRSVLQFACGGGNLKMLKHIVDLYPEMLKETDKLGGTAMHWVAYGGSVPCMEMLTKKGLDAKAKTYDGRTILHYSCEGGKEEMTRYIMKKFPEMLEQVDNKGLTALHVTALGGNVAVLELLVEQGLNHTHKSNDGHSLIHHACEKGQEEMLRYLIKKFPEMLKDTDNQGATALHWAARGGNIRVFEYLLTEGTNPQQTTQTGRTLLHWACEHGKEDIVRHLANKFPNMLTEKDNQNAGVLHFAARGGNVKILDFLLRKGLDHNAKTKGGRTLLHYACEKGREDMTKELVSAYPEMLEDKDSQGAGVLHWAALGGNDKILKYLLEVCTENQIRIQSISKSEESYAASDGKDQEGFDELYRGMLHETDEVGATLLHFAAYGGNIEVLETLLREGLDINCKTDNGRNVLHFACNGGEEAITKYLCKHNPHMVKETDDQGITALHLAVLGGNVSVLDHLLQQGIDIKTKTTDGLNILHFSCQHNKEEIVRHIAQQYPVMCQELDDNGATILHWAAVSGNVNIVDFLVKQGVDPKQKSFFDETAEDYAREAGKRDMVEYLNKLSH